jgi:hypothetical protein
MPRSNPSSTPSVKAQPSAGRWVETALTALCTASAVLFVSFIAVVTGLV